MHGSDLEPAAGTAIAVVRNGTILLGRRIAAHGNGLLQMPGGKPDANETLAHAAIRELEEETGLRAGSVHEVAEQTDNFPEIGKRYITHFFVTTDAEGEPENREPEKCESWEWYPLDALPGDLFAIDDATIGAIKQVFRQNFRRSSSRLSSTQRAP
jgi:8-oxo-dGTP diphosphatase